jgi:Polyketide cyclase / dehydrase and lipid transport
MLHVEEQQIIERPPTDVFRFVATEHFANHPKWDPNVVEMVPSSAGPIGVGSTARLVRNDRGKRIEGSAEVIEYQPDRLFGIVSRFGPFILQQRATCEARPEGKTLLHLSIDTKANGMVRLLLPFLKGQFRKNMAASLQSIKQHVEGQR